jgi:spore coat polysaccharide biosynthesis protein SpsF
MASTRLPGKVLADLGGEPMLVRVVQRVSRATTLEEVIIATSWEDTDQPIAELCRVVGYNCFRGHPLDVLDRVFHAAQERKAEVVVRLTADCPLIDPGVLDRTVEYFLHHDPPLDFAANRLPRERTFPIGLDVEVASFSALEKAYNEAQEPAEREHVMPYLYGNPKMFRIGIYTCDRDLSEFRWTVDTVQDLELIRAVYHHFEGKDDFTWEQVLALFKAKPELKDINALIEHRTHLDFDDRFVEGG